MSRYPCVRICFGRRSEISTNVLWNTIPLNPCFTARTPRLLIEECREVKAKQFLGLNAVWVRTGVNPTSSMKCISYNEIGYDTRYYGVPGLSRNKGHRRISRIDVPRPLEGLNSCKNRETYTFFSGSAHRHVSNAFPVLPHSFVQG